MKKTFETVIVGGGAAGFFGGLRLRALAPRASILVLESAARPQGKVLISGGGRCNVTHDLNDLEGLLEFYPRGGPALASILRRFMPADTVKWFESHGVKLKTEADGRMFPVTDRSQSIVDCLLKQAARSGLEVRSGDPVKSIALSPEGYLVQSKSGLFSCRTVLLASGSSPAGYRWATALGHDLIAPVPSLFSFKVDSPLLQGLAGVSLSRSRASLLLDPPITQEGPLLVTHWGLSGPAILKLSAWGARVLADCSWRCPLSLDLVPDHTGAELRRLLLGQKQGGRHQLGNPPLELPRSLWRAVLKGGELEPQRVWAEASNRALGCLAERLKDWRFEIVGRGVFKDEFVTAGGVPLEQVQLKTLESRRSPGLFLAGEILNVDGLTGGFNFQSAWASGWVAGQGIAARLQ